MYLTELCHTSIMNVYNDAEEAVRSLFPAIGSLESIRTELAGAWCPNDRIIWEIGALENTLHQPQYV